MLFKFRKRDFQVLSTSILVSSFKTILSLSLLSVPVTLQAAQEKVTSEVEEMIVTGSRRALRTKNDSTAPIDMVNSESLSKSTSEELMDILAANIPSYNIKRLPMADGSIFVRPATLRGLDPDHTLVLINGKRRHRSAMHGTGVDLASIPSAAIKRVEVLRDGASAQYGSDAIAGVINIILDDSTGFEGKTQYGQYYEGDGENIQQSLKYGFNFGNNGHFNISAEYSDAQQTSRSKQRNDAIEFMENNPDIELKDPVQNWGQPERKALKMVVDFKLDLDSTTEVYTFSTYSQGEGESDFNWRNPDTNSVYNSAPIAFPDWDLTEVYPAGFSPRFGQEDYDVSLFSGIRGDNKRWSWDVSAGAGKSNIQYNMANSINASFGPESPTDFDDLGSYIQSEITFNADFIYDTGVKGTLISFGTEYRDETFETVIGQYESYAYGPGSSEGLPGGSSGFPGFSPDSAGKWDSNSMSLYVELDSQLTDALRLTAASRYEDYDAFDSEVNLKLSARYELNFQWALRGSLSTGFRAPTSAELYSTSYSQGLDSELNIYSAARLSPNSDAAIDILSAEALKPEEATNLAAGLTFSGNNGLYASLDLYAIDINDRISEAPWFGVDDATQQALSDANIAGAKTLTWVTYYTNNYDTETRGFDLVAGYDTQIESGTLSFNTAINWNDTKYVDAKIAMSDAEKTQLEDGIPELSGNFSLTYNQANWSIMGRVRAFGPWSDQSGLPDEKAQVQEFDPIALFDIRATLDVSEHVSLTLGAENLFNTYPDKATYQESRGLLYSRNAPYDTDGGFYYLSINYTL